MKKRYDCMNCYRRNAVTTVHGRKLCRPCAKAEKARESERGLKQ